MKKIRTDPAGRAHDTRRRPGKHPANVHPVPAFVLGDLEREGELDRALKEAVRAIDSDAHLAPNAPEAQEVNPAVVRRCLRSAVLQHHAHGQTLLTLAQVMGVPTEVVDD